MAKHELSGPAAEVMFSTDYGRCWRRVPLESAIALENIRCALGALHAFVFGLGGAAAASLRVFVCM